MPIFNQSTSQIPTKSEPKLAKEEKKSKKRYLDILN